MKKKNIVTKWLQKSIIFVVPSKFWCLSQVLGSAQLKVPESVMSEDVFSARPKLPYNRSLWYSSCWDFTRFCDVLMVFIILVNEHWFWSSGGYMCPLLGFPLLLG